MIASALLIAVMAAQPDAPAAAYFSPAEVRTMCSGGSAEPLPFRTDAAFRLHAEQQRARCRMYLLGLADGIGRSLPEPGSAFCPPPAGEREDLADRLAEAVLSEAGGSDVAVPAIVRRTLASHYRCR